MTTKKELNQVKLEKGTADKVNSFVTEQKSKIVGLFNVHKNSIKVLNKSNEKSILTPNGVTAKKGLLPFEVFGTYTLDKFLSLIGKENFLGLFKVHTKGVIQLCSLEKSEFERICKRGHELNDLKKRFESENVSGNEFIKALFEYFPSFYEGLKEEKIAPNVAKFIFENDSETYSQLNISKVYDVKHEETRSKIRKEYGRNGLIEFDAMTENGVKVTKAVETLNIKAIELSA